MSRAAYYLNSNRRRYCFQMEVEDQHRERFLAITRIDLKDKRVYDQGILGIILCYTCNFFSSNFIEHMQENWYDTGDGTRRARSILYYPSGTSTIIVEAFVIPGTSPNSDDSIVHVALDRYQLFRTERVYPSVYFKVASVRKFKPSQFFTLFSQYLRNTRFLA